MLCDSSIFKPERIPEAECKVHSHETGNGIFEKMEVQF